MFGRMLSLAIALVVAMVWTAPAEAGAIKWRYFTYVSPNDFHAKMNKAWAEDVTKASDGKLEITHFAAGELPYKAADVVKAVATNQIEMGQVGAGLIAGDVPELDVFSMPFICTTYPQFDAAVKAMGTIPDEVLTKKFGIRVTMQWPIPAQNIWLTQKVEKLDDLKGRKIRTWNPPQVDMLKLFGASPMSIDPSEVLMALQRKVVDGAITSALSANDWKAYDIVKYGFMLNFTMAHQFTFANVVAFNALPADMQKLIVAKSEEWAPRYYKESEATDQTARQNMQKNGVTLIDPSPADVKRARELLHPLWNAWAGKNGPVAKQLLDKVGAACAAN
jgi:TRAP-type C4-dicarboxylate transport system substrate-binding protein